MLASCCFLPIQPGIRPTFSPGWSRIDADSAARRARCNWKRPTVGYSLQVPGRAGARGRAMSDVEPITSLQNPRVKQVVKLRDRRDRDREGKFLIEGFRELTRAIEALQPLTEVYTCAQFYLGSHESALLEAAASRCNALIQPVTADVFRKLSYRDRPDGLLALAPRPDWTLDRLRPQDETKAPLFLVAQSIEKPGNLGTLLRTADAAAVDGVVVVDRCTDLFNPNVVRASVGTMFTVPVAEATSDEAFDWFDQ
ncbi:MAG TPA: hypothetical protein EYN40_00170, partial [Planctomycetes bacterium]|nr:hypothetical protein [Planctomycetota bacterium]